MFYMIGQRINTKKIIVEALNRYEKHSKRMYEKHRKIKPFLSYKMTRQTVSGQEIVICIFR